MKTKEEFIKYWDTSNRLDSIAMKGSEKYPEETTLLKEAYIEALYRTCLAHEALYNKVKELEQIDREKYDKMLKQVVYSRELKQLSNGTIQLVLHRISIPEGFKPKPADSWGYQDAAETIEDCHTYLLVGANLYEIGSRGGIYLTKPEDSVIKLTDKQVESIKNGEFPLELITYNRYIIK